MKKYSSVVHNKTNILIDRISANSKTLPHFSLEKNIRKMLGRYGHLIGWEGVFYDWSVGNSCGFWYHGKFEKMDRKILF